MTPERWSQIEEIFQTALDLPPAERSKFVRESCGEDADLRGEVEKLLSQFDESSGFIEQPPLEGTGMGVLASLIGDDEDPVIGRTIGQYRIEREIGRGGMGTVYEAVRADGVFRMRAAIKIVKRGMDTDFILRRFKNERQILATLEHPYITRLLDGGTTDDGRPYFVMDYIDGAALYRYCDKNRLSISERLQLFCRVCEAVEYAHQKLVIHRDLKPSNIIVTDDGTPRLLDFGIAKLLDPDLAFDTLQPTATALRMMTVDYASPEQIRGEKVTYATDIYSLGVILFELLTGFRPYAFKSRAPHEIARAICDEEPGLPSAALLESQKALSPVKVDAAAMTLAHISDRRRETPAHLAEQLRGNLDNITMKALRKDPADRYSSVADLRLDIEQHLKGEPVSIEFSYRPRRVETSHEITDDSKLVAVLPLSLMSPMGTENTDEAYLTIGLADAIITRLTSVRKLTVRPTSSITRYNEPQVNPLRAGMELGVDFVLDGRIRRFGDRLRISLQLLDVKNGTAIWAGQFDEQLVDVLELEDAISEQVAAALIPHLTGEEKQKLAKRSTNNPQAYGAYLRGRFYWNQFTVDSFSKAIESFERAVELDPNYALAYVGIADFYIWGNIYGLIPASVYYDNATAAAMRALEIDDQLGEAYASLALITMNRFDVVEAERLMSRGIELVPNYQHGHEWYSAILVSTGRFEQGLEEIRLSEELDPLSLRTKTLVSWTYYQTGNFDISLEKAEEIIGLDANYPQGHLQRGNALIELGRPDEAIASIEQSMALMPGSSLPQYYLGFALSAAGRQADAKDLVEEMKASAASGYVKPMFLGLACLAAGELDDAFGYLETAVDEYDPWLVWLGTEPKLKPVHDDPRFRALLGRAGKLIVDGTRNLRPANTGENAPVSGKYAEAETMPMSDSPTLGIRAGFFRRNAFRLGAAMLLLIVIAVGYQFGFIGFEFRGRSIQENVPSAATRSIAVLPFENQTGDTANDYISDGMSESLINRMTSSTDIRTISRAAAFGFRGKTQDPQAVGRELGVDDVLVGTLTKEGQDLVVNTELVRVSDGKKLFTMHFAENADQIMTLQNVMVARVIETLSKETAAQPVAAHKGYTENNEAFQMYLKGEFHRQKGTPGDTKTSIEFYENAIRLDANYALAYQGLALAYRSAPAYGTLSPQEAYPKAKEAAQAALRIDPSLSAALVALASMKATWDWDYAGAEHEYKRAISLGPNNAEAHYSYANFLVAMARSDEALVEYRNALQLDPPSLNIATNMGWAMYIAGRNDEAIVQVRQVIAHDPTFARAYMNLGEILEEQGKYDEAIAAFQKARELSKDPLADMALGHVYATAGRRAEATKIAVELEEKVRQKQVSPFLPAVVYAGLNEKDKAFYWLERAYQERSNWLTLIKVGRRLKTLHGDPRFDDLLKRVGF